MELSLPNKSTTPSLCGNHYYKLYKYQYKKQMNYTTCSTKSKPLKKFNRHCPNPTVVKYLRATQDFSGKILDDDLVCYKWQCELLETLDLFNFPTTQETRSSDLDLDVLLEGVMGMLQHSEHQSEGYTVLSTALMVGLALRKDTAILPTAYKHFLSHIEHSQVSQEWCCHWLLRVVRKTLELPPYCHLQTEEVWYSLVWWPYACTVICFIKISH